MKVALRTSKYSGDEVCEIVKNSYVADIICARFNMANLVNRSFQAHNIFVRKHNNSLDVHLPAKEQCFNSVLSSFVSNEWNESNCMSETLVCHFDKVRISSMIEDNPMTTEFQPTAYSDHNKKRASISLKFQN